jgi:hypothetical protein
LRVAVHAEHGSVGEIIFGDHSTFSVNRHGRFRDRDIFRQFFEAVVRACMNAGLVKGKALPSMQA